MNNKSNIIEIENENIKKENYNIKLMSAIKE